MNRRGDDDDHPPWYDYPPGQERIPDNVKFLRIGFLQYQLLLQGNTTDGTIFEIGAQAFQGHSNLQQVQIYLPAVSKILNLAFYHCESLEKIEFVLKPKTGQEDVDEEQQEEESSTLPSQLVSIGASAFNLCVNLHSVVGLEQAEESLQTIGSSAFQKCHSLSNVDFMGSLTQLKSLGPMAFWECKSLTAVDLSKAVGLTKLYRGTFKHCSVLKTIRLPPNLLETGSFAFGRCKKLTTIVLPASLQIVGTHCFAACEMLSCVVLPSPRVPFLLFQPFSECSSLSRLELPTPVLRQQWPLILEQLTQDYGIASCMGRIPNPKNRNTIIWNFLRQNMTQLFVQDNAVMSR